MSKFHSTISRRDFMKAIGFAGAGIGAAAATTPVFHDLDELSSSTSTHAHHPWYVKERDFEDITTPVDWSVFEAYDPVGNPTPNPDVSEHRTKVQAWYTEGIINDIPNRQHRDWALRSGNNPPQINFGGMQTPWDGEGREIGLPGYDVPKYQGTAEENLQMVRAGLHQLGASSTGAFEVNDHTKRLFDKGFVQFRDVDQGFLDMNDRYAGRFGPTPAKVIPNFCRTVITWVNAQDFMLNCHSAGEDGDPSRHLPLGDATDRQAYAHGGFLSEKAMAFIKALGYHAYRPCFFQGVNANVPMGVFSGLTEQGRPAFAIEPKRGAMIRYTDHIVTDLPVAPTKPIDAGLSEFCKTCGVCSDACPTGACSQKKDITWDVAGAGNRPGFKGWFLDWGKCIGFYGPINCAVCHKICPMNHVSDASVHDLVRGTVGVTSIFNSFFATMERAMGYGEMKHGPDWWDRDLRTYKYDTTYQPR